MNKYFFTRFNVTVNAAGLVVLAACLWFFSACALDVTEAPEFRALISRTIDGDTVVVEWVGGQPKDCSSSETVRLIGVDTPETHNVPSPEPFGPEASAYTKRYTGDPCLVVFDAVSDRRDKYGRLLAYIYLDDKVRSLNELLIFGGYGRYYGSFPFAKDLMAKFKAAEESAKKNKKGLWK